MTRRMQLLIVPLFDCPYEIFYTIFKYLCMEIYIVYQMFAIAEYMSVV